MWQQQQRGQQQQPVHTIGTPDQQQQQQANPARQDELHLQQQQQWQLLAAPGQCGKRQQPAAEHDRNVCHRGPDKQQQQQQQPEQVNPVLPLLGNVGAADQKQEAGASHQAAYVCNADANLPQVRMSHSRL
jgi:hypothetical protein